MWKWPTSCRPYREGQNVGQPRTHALVPLATQRNILTQTLCRLTSQNAIIKAKLTLRAQGLPAHSNFHLGSSTRPVLGHCLPLQAPVTNSAPVSLVPLQTSEAVVKVDVVSVGAVQGLWGERVLYWQQCQVKGSSIREPPPPHDWASKSPPGCSEKELGECRTQCQSCLGQWITRAGHDPLWPVAPPPLNKTLPLGHRWPHRALWSPRFPASR